MTDAPKLPYVHSFTDTRGKLRHTFRRRGHRQITLKGQPGSPEFMAAYEKAMAGTSAPPLPPASTLVGGVAASTPLIGVYLLMLDGKLVYVGSSLHMPNRVAGHRTNGRPFDQVFYIATKANQREQLERTLIKALHPSQNTRHRTNGTTHPEL
ncbi:MAG: hypothetical protein C0480_02940 [Bradyrhizobium sp.]|nr:hypothetical protein [Bradyrhizobium sp.]